MADVATDCRSADGVTIGLIDAMICLARVLAGRDLHPPMVREALRDLAVDEDVWALLGEGTAQKPEGGDRR